MEDYEQLLKKIDKIEYTDIKELRETTNTLGRKMEKNELLIDQVVKSNEKLANVMDTIKEAMAEITANLRDGNRISQELTETVSKLNDKVVKVEGDVKNNLTKVNDRIDKIDDKGKVDLLTWLKDNWFKLVVLIAIVSYFITKAVGVDIF